MEDINKRIEKYDCCLKRIYDDLSKAIAFREERPREKNIWVGLRYVQDYEEIVGFMVKRSANWSGKFDLPFLSKETVRNLPKSELWEWKDKIPELMGRLDNIRKGKE